MKEVEELVVLKTAELGGSEEVGGVEVGQKAEEQGVLVVGVHLVDSDQVLDNLVALGK